MPVIKKKNILGLSAEQQQTVWDAVRGTPAMRARVYVRDFFPMLRFVGYNVGARGVLEFLVGDDPGERQAAPELSDADLNAIADANSPLPSSVTEERRAPAGTFEEFDHLMTAAGEGKLPEADRRES